MTVLEVPAHRIIVLSNDELKDFDLVDANGNYVSHWSTSSFQLAVRKGRVYRKARFKPNDDNYGSSVHYLEEI